VIKPNPTNEFIHIDGDFDDLRIYEIKGNDVKCIIENNTIIFEAMLKGQYIMRICNKGQCKSKLFLIE